MISSKKARLLFVSIIVVALVALAVTGCGGPSAVPAESTAPTATVSPVAASISVSAERNGAGLQISGSTNAADGTKVACEVQQTQGAWITGDRMMIVKNGRFHDALKKAPSGELQVWVALMEPSSGGKRVEATATVQ